MLDVCVKGDELLVFAMLGSEPSLLYLDERLQYQVRASLRLENEDFFGVSCAARITDHETVELVSCSPTKQYKVTNLTLIDNQEAFIEELELDQSNLLRKGANQQELMEKLLKEELYTKLAELVLERDQSQNQFLFTQKGALTLALDTKLRTQLHTKISLILQAIKNYYLAGITATERARSEQLAILNRIREEQNVIDGIEKVYRALLQMQSIVALNIQVDKELD